MLFLYFEDWSPFINMLDERGIPHGGKIIKVYTSPIDPRPMLKEPKLKLIETDDFPLFNLKFSYKDRGEFSGNEIEQQISPYSEYVKRSVRALFRFSNREDLGFTQTAMSMKVDGHWLIKNPLEDIDGLNLPDNYLLREIAAHLDVFNAHSLERMSKIVDISTNSKEILLDLRKSLAFKKELQMEISSKGPERL